MRADVDKTETGWFSESHPATAIEAAHAIAEAPGEGSFASKGLRAAIFSDIDRLSRQVSLDYYRSIVDQQITNTQLFSVADLLETQASDHEIFSAANRFFLGSLNVLTLTLDLPADRARLSADSPISKQALVEARTELLAAGPAYLEASKHILEARSRLFAIEYATLALGAGLNINVAGQDLEVSTLDDAATGRDRILHELDVSCAENSPVCVRPPRVGSRWPCSLSLMKTLLIKSRTAATAATKRAFFTPAWPTWRASTPDPSIE